MHILPSMNAWLRATLSSSKAGLSNSTNSFSLCLGIGLLLSHSLISLYDAEATGLSGEQISNNYSYNPRLFTSLYVQCAKVKLVLQTHAQVLQGKVSHNLQGSILDLHSVLILCLLCSLHFDNIKLHNLTKGMYIYCSLS